MKIDGHDVRDLTFESLRATIGLVLDEPFLFSESVASNIAYGRPDARREDIEAAARAAGAHEFIVQLVDGYDTRHRRAGLHAVGRPAPADRDRPHACSSTPAS